METNVKDLLKKYIIWKKHPTNARYIFSYDEGETILLRLNNFPDEVLWTLIKGLEIIDIEETPQNWEVPY